jgi:hypothetical protein
MFNIKISSIELSSEVKDIEIHLEGYMQFKYFKPFFLSPELPLTRGFVALEEKYIEMCSPHMVPAVP